MNLILKSHTITFVLTCISFLSFAQTGKIIGTVKDQKANEDIIGATISIQGTSIGTATDIDGKFKFSLPAGTHTLVISYVSYKTLKIEKVVVKDGETTTMNILLEENSTELGEVEIVAFKEKSTINALLIERRNAATIGDGVSAETIKKTPDRSTGDIIKRVSGASIQDNKFAIVRGMADRYNIGYLNGAPLPSTEPDRKAFSFDAIPATFVDALTIVKTATPDVSGDFGGGLIMIKTKAIPNEPTHVINIGGQYAQYATFKNFQRFKGSNTDFLGFDNSDLRKLPSTGDISVDNRDPKINVDGTKKFNNDWNIINQNSLPNLRFNYTFGTPIKIKDRTLGLITGVNYAKTQSVRFGSLNEYRFEDNNINKVLKDTSYRTNVTSGALLNLTYKPKTNNSFSFNQLLNLNTDNNTVVRSGIINGENGLFGNTLTNIYSSNRIYSAQLSGEHEEKINSLKIKWILNHGNIDRKLPDYRIVTYSGDQDGFSIATNKFFNSSSGRYFSRNKEQIYSANAELSFPINKIKGFKTEAKIGGLYQARRRQFTSSTFVYNPINQPVKLDPAIDLAQDKIDTTNVFLIEQTNKSLDIYNAQGSTKAGFIMFDSKLKEKLRLIYGVRVESFDQSIRNFKNITSVEQKSFDILPSININYSITEKLNWRASAYNTVNRPELRELAEFTFYSFETNSDIRGSNDLKISKIKNIESRVEYYPSSGEVLSFGGFYKQIKNPIEFSIDIEATSRTLVYTNGNNANNYGLEFEFRKKLNFIPLNINQRNIGNDFTVFSNIALVRSKIDFIDNNLKVNSRPMQGQSPFVFNAGLQYENDSSGWGASIIVNRVGRRIAFVGAPDKQPYGLNIWENPRTVIDLQVSKKIKKLTLKGTIGDLLHQDLIFYQDLADLKDGDPEKRGNAGVFDDSKTTLADGTVKDTDNIIFRYKMPFTVTLAASYTF